MNYQAGAILGIGSPGIPINADWKRVNFALAGYGLLVPGTISDPVTATLSHSAQKTCNITHSVTGA